MVACHGGPKHLLCFVRLDLLAAGDVRLSDSGFQARDLGADFELTNLALGAYGLCQADGTVLERYVSLQTSWTHAPTGYRVSLDQRQSDQAAPPLADPGYLTFSDGGYRFTISATRGVQWLPHGSENDARTPGTTVKGPPSSVSCVNASTVRMSRVYPCTRSDRIDSRRASTPASTTAGSPTSIEYSSSTSTRRCVSSSPPFDGLVVGWQ